MKRLYISDVIHEQLKRQAKTDGRTLQWVVEERLTGELLPSHKNYEGENLRGKHYESITITEAIERPPVNDLVRAELTGKIKAAVGDKIDNRSQNTIGELGCCLNDHRPCKHWVWDAESGEGYRNTLSGRFKEAE